MSREIRCSHCGSTRMDVTSTPHVFKCKCCSKLTDNRGFLDTSAGKTVLGLGLTALLSVFGIPHFPGGGDA